MQHAVSYKRFSSPEQARGDSTRRQTDLTEEYCKRNNVTLIDTYLDAGLSGFTADNISDNGALRTLLDAAQRGRFRRGTLLIVESLDRLSRQEISTAVRLFLDILDAGLVIVTLIDGEQTFTKERVDNDPTALIIAIVILLRANNESRNKRERARQAQANKRRLARERKIPMTTHCPTWLTVSGRGNARHFVVDEDRAAIVRRIYTMSAAGMGQHRIARLLNEEHVPAFNSKPHWRGAAVAHILVSKAVIGRMHPRSSIIENGKCITVLDPEGPIEGYYPAIIDDDLFAQARAAAVGRHTRRGGRRREAAYTNLVSGLGRCIVCGETLYLNGSFQNRFAYLRCAGSHNRDCCNKAGFPYGALEAMLLVLDDLTEAVGRFVSHHDGRNTTSPARRIAQAEGRIARAKRELKGLVFTFGEMTGAAARLARERIERLDRVVRQQEEKIAHAEAELQHASLTNRKGFFARFRAARVDANSIDLQQRYLSRAILVNELRKLIDAVVLHEHRIATIHMKLNAYGWRIIYIVDPYGMNGIQVEGPDGKKGLITAEALLAFEDRFVTGTRPSRKARPRHQLHGLLQSIPISQGPTGDWRTIRPSKPQMRDLVARAHRLITSGAIIVGTRNA